MMIDIQRSAETGDLFDADINTLIAHAPTVSAEALATAVRLMLDRHQRYDVIFTRAAQAAATLVEPQRSEACQRLKRLSVRTTKWLDYLGDLRWLRALNIEVGNLYPADRRVIADRLRATITPAPLRIEHVHLVAE